VGAVAFLNGLARRVTSGDARGAVYVEFLVAFFPVFMLFLATTQLSLLTAARLVVQHAATSSVRSAVVILNDDPSELGDAPRNSLTEGDSSSVTTAADLLVTFGLPGAPGVPSAVSGDGESRITQGGARMVPIRASAYFPLFALSPDASVLEGHPADNVERSLASDLARRAAAAFAYTRAATVVSVLDRPGSERLPETVDRKAPVTVRVTYAAHCGVPLARRLVCNALSDLVGREASAPEDSDDDVVKLVRRFSEVEDRSGFERLATSGQRFIVIEAEATLPNQGADYEPEVEEEED
jgi:hypothetical protein